MQDENGKELSENEILEFACAELADACALLFELESDTGIAAAFMADAALKYTQAILKDRDPRISEEFYHEHGVDDGSDQ